MENLEITWNTILVIASGIIILANLSKVILNWVSPIKKINMKIMQHEEMLSSDLKKIKQNEESSKMICKCLLALLEHSISGNSIEKLQNTKLELQAFLINKS